MSPSTATAKHPEVPSPRRRLHQHLGGLGRQVPPRLHPDRLIADAPTVGAWGAVVQYADRSIPDDNTEDRPEITVLGGDGITRAQARELAALILETVDRIDGWLAR